MRRLSQRCRRTGLPCTGTDCAAGPVHLRSTANRRERVALLVFRGAGTLGLNGRPRTLMLRRPAPAWKKSGSAPRRFRIVVLALYSRRGSLSEYHFAGQCVLTGVYRSVTNGAEARSILERFSARSKCRSPGCVRTTDQLIAASSTASINRDPCPDRCRASRSSRFPAAVYPT